MKFIYGGPASGVTLADGTEVLLWPGQAVDLPTGGVADVLMARGHLVPVEDRPAGKKNKEG